MRNAAPKKKKNLKLRYMQTQERNDVPDHLHADGLSPATVQHWSLPPGVNPLSTAPMGKATIFPDNMKCRRFRVPAVVHPLTPPSPAHIHGPNKPAKRAWHAQLITSAEKIDCTVVIFWFVLCRSARSDVHQSHEHSCKYTSGFWVAFRIEPPGGYCCQQFEIYLKGEVSTRDRQRACP